MRPVFPKREPLLPNVHEAAGKVVDAVARHIQPHKHAHHALTKSRVTHERPFLDGSVRLGGLTVGVTFSELHSIRAKEGVEFIQVVDFDGNSNLETVLWRKPLMQGARVELQGPALNTRVTGGGLPIDLRIVGVGITGDAVDQKSHEAVSYTAEAKLHASDLVFLVGSGAAATIAGMLGTGVTGTVAQYIVQGCAYAVPVVGSLIALSSMRWAEKVLASKKVPGSFKAIAVAHAVSDCARIFFPVAGTLANVALVGVSLALQHRHHLKFLAPTDDPPTPA